MKTEFDFLVVGCGFTGATVARLIAEELDLRVLVIDRRNHVAGNAFDYRDDAGILVHKYGPHLFHTNSQMVWDFASRFTEWHFYEHRVLADIDGKLVPLPFNLDSIVACFGEDETEGLRAKLVDEFGIDNKVPILKLRENPDPQIAKLADFVYEKVFYNYTRKQWELKPDQLDPSVTGRVPVMIGHDDRYFQDTFQAMPKDGYTRLFERLLDHPNITTKLGVEFKDEVSRHPNARIVYCGPIDEYFGYQFGHLPYRSLRFEFETLDQEWFQAAGTVNYPNDHAYTRITEFKHATGDVSTKTSIVFEYPQKHVPGVTDPYYPIPREENRKLYARYEEEARSLKGYVFFAGRLADYTYYNMDQAIARGMALFRKEINPLENKRDAV